MKVYVVQVVPEAGFGKVSQEGYTTLEQAQAFIESRSGNPFQASSYMYTADDYTVYLIYEVDII